LKPRQTIIVVTDRQLFPVREGSRARIVELIRALRASGFRVVLIARRVQRRFKGTLPAVRSLYRQWQLPDRLIQVDGDVFHGGDPLAFDAARYRAALEPVLAAERPVAVIAEYLWLAPCLDVVDEPTLKVVDTHDVMHVRGEVFGAQPGGAWVQCTRETEIELLSHAEVVLAIQPREAELLREMLPNRAILHVPHSHAFASTAPQAREPRDTNAVAFIGSRIQGNVAGMTSFIEVGWPVVRAGYPAARLLVYGDIVSRLPDSPGVEKIGFVEDLSEVYSRAAVIINPVQVGTGLKIKTVEALAHGRALVTTPCGADGLMDGANEAFLVADEMRAFGEAVLRILLDPAARRDLEERGRRFAEERYNPGKAIEELLAVVRASGVEVAGR
jgi:glycosyltransferase involved in cell wall biosynthesis